MSSRTESAALRAVRIASLSRLASWAAALLGIAFFVLFLVQAGLLAALLPQDAGIAYVPPHPEQISAGSSSLRGIDRENQPYAVTAARGWQDGSIATMVHLETIAGSFRKTTGQSYVLEAAAGTYDTTARTLALEGGVTISEPGRFRATMLRADVALEAKELKSDVAVEVKFAAGGISANGLRISDDGRRILFLNGVRARFGGAPGKGDTAP
jgi:hypothetical protein